MPGVLIGVGFFAYFLTHSLFLSQVPGLHYDEAWAANFSALLASGKLGFPLEAMSPYTVPWSHWISAFFFKVFHPSLFWDRFSGVLLSAGGVFLICLSLIREKKLRAASLFVWISAFSLALILNHRFCIEITTFQVFCFGLLTYGLVSKRGWIIVTSILLGITSHILFLAPALATWLTLRLHTQTYTRSQRFWTMTTCLCLLPFLLRVYWKIPEKEKSIALLILNGVLILDALLPVLGNKMIQTLKQPFLGIAAVLSLPCFAFLLFFAEGHWSVRVNHGWIAHPAWIGWSWAILLGGAIYQAWINRQTLSKSSSILRRDFYPWFFWTTLLIGLIATKPAPRYFEIPTLGLFILISCILGHRLTRSVPVIASLFIVVSGIQLGLNYFKTGVLHLEREEYFKFYIPRDNSSDFLPKQELVRFLGQQGCSLQNVRSGDHRMEETLHFLSLGDWPITPDRTCPSSSLIVNRKSQSSNPAEGLFRLSEIGPFVIDGSKTINVEP